MPRIAYYKIPCIVEGCGKEFFTDAHTWPDGHTYQPDPVAYKRAYAFIWSGRWPTRAPRTVTPK